MRPRTRTIVLAALLAFAGWQTATVHAQPTFFVIQPAQVSGITATTVTRSQVTLPQGVYSVNVLINITAGGTATGALTIFLEDSADGGTTWDDVVSSNSFALGAAAITQRFFVQGAIASTATSGSAAAVETLAAGTTRQGPFARQWRVREKLTGPAGSPVGATYTITATFQQ
jgi:hypothetical protein